MEYRKMGNTFPPVTANLLIINGLLWLATIVFTKIGVVDLEHYLGLHFWRGDGFNAAQMITYMFMHDQSSFTHLFFNMFSLFMFGRLLEQVLGGKRFLFYYLTSGLGAALVQQLTWELTWQNEFVTSMANANHVSFDVIKNALASGELDEFVNEFCSSFVTVGASGAVFGILLAFGMLFPNLEMYIIPIPFPLKAKWVVIGYGALELFFGVAGLMSGVAHFAHLGGMLFGFMILMYWRYAGRRNGNGNVG